MSNVKTLPQHANITDLVSFVTKLLASKNHPRPDAWKEYLNPDAFVAQPEIQRFLINRAWRLIMARVVGENTMDIRYCLVDSGEIHDWARLFETEVLPCIMRYNLPIQRQ